MDETCHYCGQPAKLLSDHMAVPTEAGLVHALCYHERADETWMQTMPDGTSRNLTAQEARTHIEWARARFTKPSDQ